MKRGLKILITVIVVISAGLTILCGLGYRMVTRSLPVTTGELTARGLQSPVRVYRDGYHIPHIIADSEDALFFAQGFVTAQDRLWQMDLWRRTAHGRLAEIIGPSALGSDSLMRTLGFARIAQRTIGTLSAESHRVLAAYCRGVNAFLEQHHDKLPLECLLLSYEPEFWKPEDCIAVSRWFDWYASSGWDSDAVFGLLVNRVGLAKTLDFFPPDIRRFLNRVDRTALPGFSALQNRLFLQTGQLRSAGGGNAWVISGDRTATGKPLLACDPHAIFSAPSMWYEIRLTGGKLNVSGLTLPGLPCVLVGHNSAIAWSITNAGVDNVDLFLESRNAIAAADVIRDTINVRDAEPIILQILETRHGPVISNQTGVDHVTDAISVRWTGQDKGDDVLSNLLLNRAVDWNGFRDALKRCILSPRTFLYADTAGHIGAQMAGRIPHRIAGSPFLPRNGSDLSKKWKGFIPFEKLPGQFDPPEGFIASANNGALSRRANASISFLPCLSSRADRIAELLKDNTDVSLMFFKRMQADMTNPFARQIRDALRPVLEKLDKSDPMRDDIVVRFLRWDGQMREGSAEAAFFSVLVQKLLTNTFHDELGEQLFKRFLDLQDFVLHRLDIMLSDKDLVWFDDVTTAGMVETQEAIIKRSVDDAVETLKTHFEDSVAKWTWGDIHRLTMRHPLGLHPLLDTVFSLGDFPLGGSSSTLNCTGSALNGSYDVTWGASARLIIDLSDWDNSIAVLPTGQSGQPMDDHYRDQVPLYLGHLYHPTLSDTSKIIHSGWEMLTLSPEGENGRPD